MADFATATLAGLIDGNGCQSLIHLIELSSITYRTTAADPALRAGRAALESIAERFSNAIEGRDGTLVMPGGVFDEISSLH